MMDIDEAMKTIDQEENTRYHVKEYDYLMSAVAPAALTWLGQFMGLPSQFLVLLTMFVIPAMLIGTWYAHTQNKLLWRFT